jgi:predicted AAA+ superfamily ATPase
MSHDVLSPSSSSFIQLAERNHFVDKSLALEEFFRSESPVHLLLRPRRCGKTTLLDMFR